MSLWHKIFHNTPLSMVVRIELIEKVTVEKLLEKNKGLLHRYLGVEYYRQRKKLK